MNESYKELFKEFYGSPCWGAKKGYGSFLTFDFGEPRLTVGKVIETSHKLGFKHKHRLTFVHGSWHLWIYMCDWAINYQDNEVAHSESRDEEIVKACTFLNGQALTDVTIKRDRSTVFSFDLGGLLKTIPYNNKETEDVWLLYCPNKKVFSQQSDGQFRFSESE